MNVVRLLPGDEPCAKQAFSLMVQVFEEGDAELTDGYVRRLLARADFWAYAALDDESVIGALTAHTLPMTRSMASEVFLYDLAVHPDHRRRGVARALVRQLVADAADAGIDTVFVPADVEDDEAIAFYRSLGATGSPVTIFDLG